MRARLLPLILLLASGKLPATDFPIEVIEFIDNARVVAFLDATDIDTSSHWQPFAGPPPLSMTDALTAIHGHIADDPELADATLSGIELKRIPHHENYWHYLVRLQARPGIKPHARYFIVLMSGKVLPGLREPEPVK
jgi:hypothetical protein